jgi:hypothetical protein
MPVTARPGEAGPAARERSLRSRAALALSLALSLASARPAAAQFILSYPTPPNGGTAGPRQDRTLVPFTLNVTDTVVANFPALISIRRQNNTDLVGPFIYPAPNIALPTAAADIPNILFEGRNQIIGQAVSNLGAGPVVSNVPATYPNGTPIVIDADTGPPNNPTLVAFGTPPGTVVQQASPFRARVTFNSTTIAPFTLGLTGRVNNIPRTPGAFAPAGEVQSTVAATLRAVQFSGTIAPLTSPVNTQAGPITVPFAVPITPPGPATPGDYALPSINFSLVRDGVYAVELRATDVANNASPATTFTQVTVDVDRVRPSVTFTFPRTTPLIIDGPVPPPPATPDRFTLTGVVSDERLQGTTVAITVVDTSLTPVLATTVPSQAGNGVFALPLDFRPGQGIVPGTPPPQDIYRIDVQARDLAGNLSDVARSYVVRDTAPPPAPAVTSPTPGLNTSARVFPLAATVTNVRPGNTLLEEHGGVTVRITLTSVVDPRISAQVQAPAAPSATRHDSDLDDLPPGFSIPPDVLGTIPDRFDFAAPVNLTGFPFGEIEVTAVAIDAAGNVSAPTTLFRFRFGPDGPAVRFAFGDSGPDDNYQFIGTRTNQRGSDDGDADGVGGFFVSLKSPERFDAGIPPSPPRPPPFNGGTDPGDTATLVLSGSASDVATPVVSITATGTSIPTTTFTVPTPGTTVTFTLPVDIRGLPEGVPGQVDVRATNAIGASGPTTSVVVFRDVFPARAPRVTFPPLLTCLFGNGTIPCFFAGSNRQVIEGVAEPNVLVVISTPVTTGTISPPIARTTNLQVPNPSSALSSLPAGAQTARADATGRFRFPSVDLSRVATSATTPVPIIVQSVDTFDNTDPVSSALAVGVFRLDRPGEVAQVRLDPRTRNFPVFPGTPVNPVVQQFFGVERIEIQVFYNTVIATAPVMTVQQTATVAAPARLIAPSAGTTPLATQVLVYEYTVPRVNASFDGPVTISITGGRDVFGFIPNAFFLSRAFFVDTVPPARFPATLLSPLVPGPTSFFPPTGAQVPAITTLSIQVTDPPAGNGSAEASCISSLFTRIRLLGPLETTPSREVALVEPPPPFVSQPVTVPCPPATITRVPAAPVTEQGTYEYRAQVGDNVGNLASFTSTFILDRSPIAPAFITCDPADGSAVTTLPRFGSRQAVFVTVADPTVGLTLSSAVLRNPLGASIGQASIPTGTNMLVVPLAAPLPGAGASDGAYRIEDTVFDQAGNPSPPSTCTFILDTLPPQILSLFPPNLGCAGPPLREVHAEVVDAVPNNGFPPAFSGVDLARTDVKVRLLVPDPANPAASGTEIRGIKRYRSTGSAFNLVAFEFQDAAGAVRNLRDDGMEDGRYRVEVTAADRAGNTTTAFAFFDHDSQPPRPTFTMFPEGVFMADLVYVFGGSVFDVGPCGLPQGVTVSALSTAAVQVSIRQLDGAGRLVVPIVPPFFDFRNVDSIVRRPQPAPFVKDEADWVVLGNVPLVPGRARVLVRGIDRAGNAGTITRDITIILGDLPAPVLVAPRDGAVTADKIVVFEWRPVIQAKLYDLELTRLTPASLSVRTTFTGLEFPFNEFRPPLVNGIKHPIDLGDFAAAAAGGSPITTASVFSWRMRALDVSLNPGPYSVPTTFVVDPTPPGVRQVRFGAAVGSIPTVGRGVTPVTIDFDEDAGMDPSSAIDVSVQPRDGDIRPIRVVQTSFTRTRWTGTLTLPPPGETRDVNGRARLVIRFAKNLAGVLLPEVQVAFDINVGPFFAVRFFSNTAVPEHLEVVIKATAHSGTTTGIELAAVPVATITQHGHFFPAPLALQVIPGTRVQNSTFRTSFRVDPELIGFLDFSVTGTDLLGAAATRTFGLSAAGALAAGGVRFPLVTRRATAVLATGAVPPGLALVGVPGDLGPQEIRRTARERAAELGLTFVSEVAYLFPDLRDLDAPVSLAVAPEPGLLPEGIRAEQVGLYRATPSGSGVEIAWIGGPGEGGTLSGSTRRLGYLALMADTAAPVIAAIEPASDRPVSDPRPMVRAAVRDAASGIPPHGVTVVLDGAAHAARYDADAGTAELVPPRPLAPGRHQVVVRARDRAGNESASQAHRLEVAGPIAITQAVAVPNPVRTGPARIRYLLTRAATRARVTVHDVTGRRLRRLPGTGFPGVNSVDWALDTDDAAAVANGVYVFVLEVEDAGGHRARSRGKIALIR